MDTRITKRKLNHLTDIVIAAYSSGLTLQKIAKQHGVAQNTVRNLLIREGVPLRKRGRKSNGSTETAGEVTRKTPPVGDQPQT